MPKSPRQATLPGMEPDDAPNSSAAPEVDVAPPATVRMALAATPTSTVPPDLTGKTVYVIDANSLIFQVFYAIPEMTSPAGQPVSAVYGFTRDMLFFLGEKKPDYLFVAYDRPEPTFRHALYEDYKSGRAEMPVDLVPQFELINRVLAALGVAVVDWPGYEADDLLATIAEQTATAGGDCLVVTADKDCRQLISDHVKIYNVRKNEIFDAEALQAEWGIRPEQVVDFQALVGDPVDAIPGVPLVGPKVAREWLEKFGSLDALLARAAELPEGKRKANLLAGREQALVSRQLARLERNVPCPIDWEAGRVGGVDHESLRALFAEFGFHRFVQMVDGLAEAQPRVNAPSVYRAVDTPDKCAAFLQQLSEQKEFSVDTETTHIRPRFADLVGLSFSWRDGEGYYLPVCAPPGEACLDRQKTLDALRPILENPAVAKVGQNLKYDLIVLRNAGVNLAGLAFDTMIASYLLDAGERNHNLDELASRYLNHTTIKIESLIGSGKKQKRMDEVPVAAVADYASEDADVAWRLRPLLARRLAEAKLVNLFQTVEVPLVEVLADLEYTGIKVDVARLKDLSRNYGERLAALEQEIYALAGRPFNIGSPQQLAKVLFEEHKLPMGKRTKTGGSTDAEVLEELARVHPLPAKIIEYRQFAKLKNTYVDALPELVLPATGRVHASFNQVVAATGRLSSSDPNLQNIPVRSQHGREIRQAFLPGHEGWKLLAADYSQIELRVLAHFSGDAALAEAFSRDEDIHARVAAEVNGVALDAVTPEMRRVAKTVNFGVIYGQSPFGLAKQLGISQDEAAKFIDDYFDRYPGVERFLAEILEACQRDGYVSTILGRRRAISGIRTSAGRQRNLPERTAINTVIQGSAADLIKLAMLNIARRLREEKLTGKMLLQIHDELVFETPADELSRLARLVRDEMSSVLELKVPLKVDLKAGDNWGDVDERL